MKRSVALNLLDHPCIILNLHVVSQCNGKIVGVPWNIARLHDERYLMIHSSVVSCSKE